MLRATFKSRYRGETDYIVRDTATGLETRVRLYDDGGWAAPNSGIGELHPADPLVKAVALFRYEEACATSRWLDEFRARHGHTWRQPLALLLPGREAA